jgi:hypothetical protein
VTREPGGARQASCGNLPRNAIDSNGRTIWIADAHRDDGKRFVVRADEKLAAFIELESRMSKEKAEQ